MHGENPGLVEVVRGERVESRHRGAAAVITADGTLVAAWGDIDSPVYARSAIKPIQALPLIETGAAERFGVNKAELALACASHGGEPKHVETVAAWLARIGLGEANLICGPHAPTTAAAAEDLIRQGAPPTRLHNNCSGKHAGFLTTALHLNEPLVGYGGQVHPVQLRIKRLLAQLAEVSGESLVPAVDGCGVPTFAVPVRGLALAAARLAAPAGLGRHRAEAASRLYQAMAAHPDLIGGTDRFDTRIGRAAAGALVTKGGAEAVHMAILAKAGLGIALKIDDGARRGAECAMAALLRRFADPPADLAHVLSAYAEAAVRNTAGARVGTIRPSLPLTQG